MYSTDYEYCIFGADFNIERKKSLKNLVRENTCFKSFENPGCIDILQLQVISKHMCIIIWLVTLSPYGCNYNENYFSYS